MTLSWEAVAHASGYQLKWNGGDWEDAITETSVTKSSLTNGTAYSYQVKAIGDGESYCDSDPTESASVTPNILYTITFQKDGSTVSAPSVVEGAQPAAPTVTELCTGSASSTFMGWTRTPWTGKLAQTAIDAKTEDDVKIYTSDALPVASGAVTYHAVFAKQVSAATETSDVINNAATSLYLGNTGTTTWADNFTITGSTGAKYYIHSMGTQNTSNALQWNTSGYLYCSQLPTSGAKLKSVAVTRTSSKNINVYASDDVYDAEPSGSALANMSSSTSTDVSYNFTDTYYAIALKGGSSGTSITSITITYGTDAVFSDYITSCCEPLADIELNVAKTSTTATLTWTAIDGVTAWSVADIEGATKGSITTNAQGKKECEFTGLTPSTEYTFTVNATTIASGKCTDVTSWSKVVTTDAPYTISVADIDAEVGELVSIEGSTITVLPTDGYRVKAGTDGFSVDGTADVTNNGNNTFTVENLGSNVTITIIFEEIPTYAVNWYVNGVSQKEKSYREGTLVSTIMADAPSVADNVLNASCGSTKFVGWVTAAYTGNEGTETTYNNSKVEGTATLSADANYYAMFAAATTDEWIRVETLGDITEGTYVIVSKANDNKYYMLPSATTSSAPTVSADYEVTRNNDESQIESEVPAGAEWNFTINNEGKYIIKNADNKILYATNTNNGLRVGTTDDTWTISVNGSAPAYLMTESTNSRCCGIYTAQDWRCYANTEQGLGNYPDGGKVYLYKHTAIYGEYRTGCTCNTVTVAIGTHTNGTLTLNDGDENVSNETCTDSEVEVRVAPDATYQFAAENAVTFVVQDATGFTAPTTYTEDNGARVYTVSIPKGTAAGTITVSASFESLPTFGINLSGVSHLTNLASSPATEALGGETVTLSYDDVEDGYTFLNWIVKGATSENTITVTNDQFQMPNDEGVVVTADIRENVSVTFYVGDDTYGNAAVTYQGGTISLPETNPSTSFDATNYPYFIGWSATNFGAATTAPALVDGSETINASTSYYAVFGNAQTAETNKYAKVNALESGKNYLIVAEYNSKLEALHAAELNKEYWLKSGEVTATNDVITSDDAEQKWQITVEAGVAHVYNAQNEKYLGVNYVSDGGHYNARIFDNECDLTIAANAGAWNISGVSNTKTVYVIHAPSYAEYIGDDEAGAIYLYKQILASTKWATKQIASEIQVSFNDNVEEEEITVPTNLVVESGNNSIDLTSEDLKPGARAGYQFSGWSLTTNGAVIDELTNITENTPLYAIWAPNPNCTIKFSVRGTVKDALQETLLQGQTFSGFASKEIAEADEVEGYDFIGWASAAQQAETTDAITPMTSYTPEVEESASEITVYALYKRVSAGADVTDEITASQLPATNGYESFDDVTITSDAVYAGVTAYNGGNIQINNNANPNKGIVSITSGGILKSIAITWGSSSNTLDIYASNAAYEEIGELYGNTPKGEVVHSFTETGSYTFEDDYSYIGIRSHSGAIYLSKIAITWSSSTTYYTTRPTALWAVDYNLNGGAWKSGEGCADGTVQEGEYTVCTDIPENGEDKLFDKWQINGVDVTTETVNITAATTFTAVWKDRGHGKVTYSANGGVISGSAPAAADVWEDEKVTVVANTFFTNPGYSFGGWNITYNDGENIQTITPNANNQFDMPAYDVTIAAVWSRKSTDKWVRVTSAGQLVPGTKYVIANVDATYAMAEQRTNNRGAIAVDQVGDATTITISDNVVQLTLGGNATDGWTFQDGTKYLQATNQDKNYLYTDAANGNYSKWTIAFSVDDNSNPITTVTAKSEGRNILRYNPNNGDPIFSCYASNSSVQNPVNLYIKAPKVDVTTEVDASVITAEGTDVTIKNGGVLNINAEKSVGDVHVENGGQIALTQNLAAHDLYIESKAGQSAQVSGADKITLSGNLYMDIQLCNGSLDANYWYSIAVPFDVNLNDGVFLADNTPLTNRSDFEVWGYNTQKRADTQLNGWERVTDNMMHAGKAYLIGFNPGQPNIIRLKAAEGWQDNLFDDAELEVTTTSSGGTTHDNWNGLANPTMRYIDVNADAQAYNNNTHGWNTYALDATRYNFVVGTAFFVQTSSPVTISNTDHGNYRAPQRAGNKFAYAVQITREGATEFDNQMIVRASEDATNAYEQGHDMLTMNNATSNTAALLWTENYGGKRLAIEEAPLVNNQAMYDLRIYAPAAGTYSLSAAAIEGADLYVTYNGAIIWNLSLGDYEMDLTRGTTTGYGLLLVAQPNQMPTGVENGELLNGENGVQKILLNGQLYILRDGHLYDAVGKEMK